MATIFYNFVALCPGIYFFPFFWKSTIIIKFYFALFIIKSLSWYFFSIYFFCSRSGIAKGFKSNIFLVTNFVIICTMNYTTILILLNLTESSICENLHIFGIFHLFCSTIYTIPSFSKLNSGIKFVITSFANIFINKRIKIFFRDIYNIIFCIFIA